MDLFTTKKIDYLGALFKFALSSIGGTGVPPGTRPETCRPCRGSGTVCYFIFMKSSLLHMLVLMRENLNVVLFVADNHAKRSVQTTI